LLDRPRRRRLTRWLALASTVGSASAAATLAKTPAITLTGQCLTLLVARASGEGAARQHMAYARCTASSTTEDARGFSPDSRTHNFKLSYGDKSSGMIAVWERAWDEFVPFLAFPSPIRKVLSDPTGLLEGDGEISRLARFRGEADRAAKTEALRGLIAAWIELKS
jgi:hypothetical protein